MPAVDAPHAGGVTAKPGTRVAGAVPAAPGLGLYAAAAEVTGVRVRLVAAIPR